MIVWTNFLSDDSRNFIKDINIFVNEMGGACSAYAGGDRRIQGFGGETRVKETAGETQA
jgi:hypothetical protein